MSQIFSLRREILPLINRLLLDKNQGKIELCFAIMEEERLQAPHLLQGAIGASRQGIAERLRSFYIEDGKLDLLHQRIGTSVIKVWQKLRSHLRELERKNNRLADLGNRIGEIAGLPAAAVPDRFMSELLAPANMYGDMHYWDSYQKADPPEPRKKISPKQAYAKTYLKPKKLTDKPIQTMSEARLTELEKWLHEKIIVGAGSARVSTGKVEDHDDFSKIMELAQSGFLNEGRRLASIGCQLSDLAESVSLTANGQKLSLRDIEVNVEQEKVKV